MLRRIWQWLKGWFGRLFGVGTRPSHRSRQAVNSTREDTPIAKPLDDSDFEYLFRQLLEGVMHGWQSDRVVRWFEALKGRTTKEEWVAWLNRFGERVLASPSPNNELGTRLVHLGEMIGAMPSLREIGEVAYGIGIQLLNRNPGEPIWEYHGPDGSPSLEGETTPLIPGLPQAGGENDQMPANAEVLSLDELLARLQEDENLLQLIAQQLGIEISDPQVIVQALINQFNAASTGIGDEVAADHNQDNHKVENRDLAEAIAFSSPVLEVPDNPEGWNHQGLELAESGRGEEALACFDQAIELKPDDYDVWINRGNTLVDLGRFEEAIASYDRALQFKPDSDDAWNNRGLALLNLGRTAEAIAAYEQAIQCQPNCHEAWFNRGNVLAALGRTAEAIASYDKTIEIQPDSYQAWMNRGILLRYIGRNEDAIASCDHAIEINPNSHEVWHIRGAVLYDSGNTEAALASFDKAIEIKSDFQEAWHNRGLALRKLGRLEEAGLSFAKAQEIQNKNG